VKDNEGNTYQADAFADLIIANKAKTIAKYNSGWHSPYAAVTVNKVKSKIFCIKVQHLLFFSNLKSSFYQLIRS